MFYFQDRSCFLFSALTEQQLLAVLSDTSPTFFSPIPDHTLQNVNVILPVEGNSFSGPISPQSAVDVSGQFLENPAQETIKSRDPVILPKQVVEIPKLPAENPQTNTAQSNKKSDTSSSNQADKISMPVSQGQPKNDVPSSGQSTFINQDQQNIAPAMSFLMLEEQHNRRCPFIIHFADIPDLFLSREEFDLMYLLPALRAQFLDGRCRTEGMKVYLDWLTFLRERVFTM